MGGSREGEEPSSEPQATRPHDDAMESSRGTSPPPTEAAISRQESTASNVELHHASDDSVEDDEAPVAAPTPGATPAVAEEATWSRGAYKLCFGFTAWWYTTRKIYHLGWCARVACMMLRCLLDVRASVLLSLHDVALPLALLDVWELDLPTAFVMCVGAWWSWRAHFVLHCFLHRASGWTVALAALLASVSANADSASPSAES